MKLTPQQMAKILKSIKDHEASYGKTTSPTSFVYMASLLSDHITAMEADLKQSDFELDNMTTCAGELQDSYNAMEEALKKLARLGNEPHLGNSEGNVIAQQALLKQEQE